eukprot:1192986-Prorocentrum_minimum.AAC.2
MKRPRSGEGDARCTGYGAQCRRSRSNFEGAISDRPRGRAVENWCCTVRSGLRDSKRTYTLVRLGERGANVGRG